MMHCSKPLKVNDILLNFANTKTNPTLEKKLKKNQQTCLELSASEINPSANCNMEDTPAPSGVPGTAVDLLSALAHSPVCSTNRSTCCCVELSRKP